MLTTALALIVPLHLVPLPTPQEYSTPRTQPTASSVETTEGIEIFRRLVTRRLEQSTTSEGANAGTLQVISLSFQSFNGRPGSSRGYHLPGVGALYSMDLSVPVVEDTSAVEPPAEEDRPRSEADREWERMRRRVLTGRDEEESSSTENLFDSLNGMKGRKWKLDDLVIDEIERTVLEMIGRHGVRIPGLRGDETITVALHLQGNSQLPVALSEPGASDGTHVISTWGNIYASQQVAPVRLVVSVPVRALEGFGTNGGGLDTLRRSSRVHRY